MENNDSPYIYEKPLRSEIRQRTKRLASLSALGLVGMVGVFGGSAIANTVVSTSQADATVENETSDVIATQPDELVIATDPLTSAATVEQIVAEPAPVISVPLQSAKPRPSAPKVELPALPTQSFGNTSSATPSVGSGNYSAGSAQAKFEARGERHERSDSSNDSDEHEDEND
jgi:hypothetical protein